MKNKILSVFTVLILLMFIGCEKPDTEGPEFKSSELTGTSTNIALDSSFTFTFTEDLSEESVNEKTVKIVEKENGNPVKCSVSLKGSLITIKPVNSLSQRTEYKIIISGIMDKAGNKLAEAKELYFKTLIVDKDYGENPVIPDVESGKIAYVATIGDDSTGDGSKLKPFKSIQKAFDHLAAEFGTTNGCQIWVATGIYEQISYPTLFDGISLYGGFDSTTWNRYPIYNEKLREKHQTLLKPSDDAVFYDSHLALGYISDGDSSSDDPSYYKSIVVDGFSFSAIQSMQYLQMGFSPSKYSIKAQISNNTFLFYSGQCIATDGGNFNSIKIFDNSFTFKIPEGSEFYIDAWDVLSLGYESADKVVISRNKFVADCDSSFILDGLTIFRGSINQSEFFFTNNLIYLNNVKSGHCFEFYDEKIGAVNIYNNTMIFSNNNSCKFFGFENQPEGQFNICNNIISMGSLDCKNSFFCSSASIWDISKTFSFNHNVITGVTEKEAEMFLKKENQSIDVNFVDIEDYDFSVKANNPLFVLTGGLDLSDIFLLDINKKKRSNWTLGAYEF